MDKNKLIKTAFLICIALCTFYFIKEGVSGQNTINNSEAKKQLTELKTHLPTGTTYSYLISYENNGYIIQRAKMGVCDTIYRYQDGECKTLTDIPKRPQEISNLEILTETTSPHDLAYEIRKAGFSNFRFENRNFVIESKDFNIAIYNKHDQNTCMYSANKGTLGEARFPYSQVEFLKPESLEDIISKINVLSKTESS